ncbi:MAG: hypothetical protein JO265_15125 [Acidimicrobiia bacterium]|nr:hypothetical protein [Acidimicrobiia bacterium]
MASKELVVRSEVPLVNLMSNSAILSHLLSSGEKGNQAIIGQVRKMAAILSVTSLGHGAFSPVGQ